MIKVALIRRRAFDLIPLRNSRMHIRRMSFKVFYRRFEATLRKKLT